MQSHLQLATSLEPATTPSNSLVPSTTTDLINMLYNTLTSAVMQPHLQQQQPLKSTSVINTITSHIGAWQHLPLVILSAVFAIASFIKVRRPIFNPQKTFILIGLVASVAYFVHSLTLQYFFSTLYEPFCHNFKGYRFCWLVNIIDGTCSLLLRFALLRIVVFWVDILVEILHLSEPTRGLSWQRLTHIIYWLALILTLAGCDFITLLSLLMSSTSNAFTYMFRIFSLPLYFALIDTVMIVCFFVIGIMIRKEVSKNNVTFSNSIGEHLKKISFISIVVSVYYGLGTFARIGIAVFTAIAPGGIANLGGGGGSSNVPDIILILRTLRTIFFEDLPFIIMLLIVALPTLLPKRGGKTFNMITCNYNEQDYEDLLNANTMSSSVTTSQQANFAGGEGTAATMDDMTSQLLSPEMNATSYQSESGMMMGANSSGANGYDDEETL